MRFLVLALLAFIALPASAKVLTFNWTNATQYRMDGGPLQTIPANGLRDTIVTYGICANGLPGTVNRGTVTAAAPLQTATSVDVPAGTYCATAVHRLAPAAFPGATLSDSVASNAATIVVSPPVVQPSPPTFIDIVVAFVRRIAAWLFA